ncbi:MAG: hypothetical protein AAFX99_02065, partial [Myxococcota bacterium]
LDFGIQVNRAVVTAVRPERAVEDSLQAKTRERLKMEADAAGFERRAKATEQERAIQEAELANRLALAHQREELIAQEAANDRAEAESSAVVTLVEARSTADAARIHEEEALKALKARNAVAVTHEQELVEVRVGETQRLLSLHTDHPGSASAIAMTQLPQSMTNVRVLTLGDAGLQSALERIANARE